MVVGMKILVALLAFVILTGIDCSGANNQQSVHRHNNDENACPPHEVANHCGRVCELTCTTIINHRCYTHCDLFSCTCDAAYVRNSSGECILPHLCPSTRRSLVEPERQQERDNNAHTCGKNQVFKKCGRVCERSCDTINILNPLCNKACARPACTCNDGYVRNIDGQCVSPNQCRSNGNQFNGQPAQEDNPISVPTCHKNEFLNPCGKQCEKTCKTALLPHLSCTDACNHHPACQCLQGYVRNKAGQCIKWNRCLRPGNHQQSSSDETPNDEDHICGENEVFNRCGRLCEANCGSISHPNCNRTCAKSNLACACKEGYSRNGAGRCVAHNQCHLRSNQVYADLDNDNRDNPDDHSDERCQRNEFFNPCGNACEKTCRNAQHPHEAVICDKSCQRPACHCNEGLFRDKKSGKCVKPKKCPKHGQSEQNDQSNQGRSDENDQRNQHHCPTNEQWHTCGIQCEKKCRQRVDNKFPYCTTNCNLSAAACGCKAGFARNNDQICIKESNC